MTTTKMERTNSLLHIARSPINSRKALNTGGNDGTTDRVKILNNKNFVADAVGSNKRTRIKRRTAECPPYTQFCPPDTTKSIQCYHWMSFAMTLPTCTRYCAVCV